MQCGLELSHSGIPCGVGHEGSDRCYFVECSAGPDKREKLQKIFMWGNFSYD